MQEFIYYNSWVSRGKIQGLHNEFGRCVFHNIDEISIHYCFTPEEKIEFMLRIQDFLKLIDNL